MKHRVLVGVLVTVAVLLLGVVVMFAFGAPQQGQVPLQSATVASAGNGALAGGDATAPVTGSPVQPGSSAVTTGEVPAPDPNSPLMIEIPGCVCHSDDPALVKQHQGYRMNQCFGCHQGGMPEMGQ